MPAPEKQATALSSVRAIVTSSSWLLASAIFVAATQWLIVSLVARSRGAAGLGEISLAQAYVTCVSYVGWLALRNHYVVEASNFRYSDYLFLRVVFPILLFLLLTLGSSAGFLGNVSLWPTILAFSFLKTIEGLSDLNSAVFQRFQRSRAVAISAGLRFAATLLFFPAVFYTCGNVELAIAATAMAWLVSFGLFDNRLRKQSVMMDGGLFSMQADAVERRWKLFQVSFPLGLSGAIMILNTYTPRFGIDYHLGRAALGEFTAIQYFVNFGGMFVAVVCQAALPVLARTATARSSRQFFGIAAGLVVFVLVGCVLAWILIQVAGRQVLAAIYGAGFADVQPLFAAAVPCMFFIFAGSVAAVAGTALRIYRLILFAYIASAVAAAGLTWLLVPQWGIFGSFLALGAAGIAQCLIIAVGIVAGWFGQKRRPDNG